MLDRLIGICFALLAAAVAIYVAVRLIESIATALISIVAVVGGLVVLGFITTLVWRRNRMNRW
ncbi:hypothetical protein [Ferrimicrobium acidiphilum]|uniref:hypothetical protein n=1 Tax=Ferrimicrobium acidiphilum TaxID=121039 RepID=UPI0023F41B63|nr:hypothetical protein [Ferrimicrobium acidiphilum]